MNSVSDNDLTSDFGLLVDSSRFLTKAYIGEGRIRHALEITEALESLLHLPEASPMIKADIYTNLGWARGWWASCVDHRLFPAALASAVMAVAAAEEGGSNETMANALEIRAFVAYESTVREVGGDFNLETAKGDIGTAIYLWSSQGLTARCLEGQLLLGNIKFLQGAIKEARQIYHRISKKTSDDNELAAHALCGLARIAEQQGSYGEAESLLNKSVQLYEDNFHQFYLPFVYCSLGRLATRRQAIELARELLNKALKLASTMNNQRTQAEAHEILAEIAELTSHEANALTHWRQAFEYATALGSHLLIGRYAEKLQLPGTNLHLLDSEGG